jgi:carbon monoxide dehydrogenase subunit G
MAARNIRRHVAALLAASMLIGLAAPASSADAPPAAPVTVGVEHDGEVYVVIASFTAPVAPAAAWAVLTDFDHMADFMPSLKASRVLDHKDSKLLVEQRGTMELGTFRMPFESQRTIEMFPPNRIDSSQLRGNMQRVDSVTTVNEVPGGTRVDYRIEIVPKLWMPQNIAGPLLKNETERQFTAILKEIVRRKAE